MKNFQTVVQELLHNHERQRRYVAFVTALCMIMAFTVSIILIEPAESMTGELACNMSQHIHTNECRTLTCDLEEGAEHTHTDQCWEITCGKEEHTHSENCYIHEDEQAAEIMQINEPAIFDEPMAIADDVPENESSSQNDEADIAPQADTPAEKFQDLSAHPDWVKSVTAEVLNESTENDIKKYTVKFNINYFISPKDTKTFFRDANNHTLKFNLSEISGTGLEFSIDSDQSGIVCGSTGVAIGTFKMTEEGEVTITFDESFVNVADDGIDGYFYFQADATGGDGKDADVDVFGQTVTIPFERKDKPEDLSITKKYNEDFTYENGEASFNVQISSKNGVDDDPLIITDVLSGDFEFDGLTEGKVVTLTGTINNERGESGNTSPNIVKATVHYNEAGELQLEIDNSDKSLSNGFSYTWNCPVKLKEDSEDNTEVKASNTANASCGNVKAGPANAEFTEKLTPGMSKSGTYNSKEDTIDWVIVVENPQGVDLNGSIISDDYLSEASADSLKLCYVTKDAENKDVQHEDSVTLTGGSYVFPSGSVNTRYELHYSTSAKDFYGKTVHNDAHFAWWGDESEDSADVDVPKQQEVQKTGLFDGEYIEWTITIQNPYRRDLKGFTISDQMLNSGNGEVSDVKLNNEAISLTDGVYTFGKNSIEEKYTLTYKTKVNDGQKGTSLTNKAELKNGEIVVDDATTTVQIPEKNQTLNKSVSSNIKDGKIKWTLTISNPYGDDLSTNNLSVTDDFFGTDKAKNLTVKGADGEALSDSDYQISGTTLTFTTSQTQKYYYIEYETDIASCEKGKILSNTANIQGQEGVTQSFTVPNDFYSLEKKGTHDSKTDIITWTVTIKNEYGLNLAGKKLTDSYLKTGKYDTLEVVDAIWNKLEQGTDYTVSDEGITFAGNKEFRSTSYTFTYTTRVVNGENGKRPLQVYNKAEFEDKKAEFTVTPPAQRNTLTKSSGTIESENGNKVTINWTAKHGTVEGELVNQTFTDTLSTGSDIQGETTIDNLKHYMTSTQLEGISISATDADGNKVEISKDNDYSITGTGTDENGNYTGFTIEWKSTDNVKKITDFTVTYSTTGEGIENLSGSDFKTGDKLLFKNKISGNGKSAEAQTPVEKKKGIVKKGKTASDEWTTGVANWSINEGASNQLKKDETGNYKLSWQLVVNGGHNYSSDKEITITDTLPEGIELQSAKFVESGTGNILIKENSVGCGFTEHTHSDSCYADENKKDPICGMTEHTHTEECYVTCGKLEHTHTDSCYKDGNKSGELVCKKEEHKHDANCRNWDSIAYIEQTEQGLTFHIPASVHNGNAFTIEYECYVSSADMTRLLIANNGVVTFDNTAKIGEETSKQTQSVEGKVKDLSKSVSPEGAWGSASTNYNVELLENNRLCYTLDINPYERKLDSDGDGMITVIDSMNNGGVGQVVPTLDVSSLKIYQVKEDGTLVQLSSDLYTMDYKVKDADKNVGSKICDMTLKLPDKMHLQIEYTYNVELAPNSAWSSSNCGNSVEIVDSKNSIEVGSGYIYKFKESTAGAGAVTGSNILVEKIREGHYEVKINGAEFTLARWNSSNNKWEYVKEVTTKDDLTEITFSENEKDAKKYTTYGSGVFALPDLSNYSGYYQLHEVDVPVGYYADENDKYFYFVTDPAPEETVTPPDVPLIHEIQNDSLTISNKKREISVEKSWENEPNIMVRPDSVQVQLYQSNSLPSVPTGYHKVTVNVTDIDSNHPGTKQVIFAVKDGEGCTITLSGETTNVSFKYNDMWTKSCNIELDPFTPDETTKEVVKNIEIETDRNIESIDIIKGGEKIEGDTIQYENPLDAEKVGDPVTLDDSNSWRYSWTEGLEDGAYYYIEELNPDSNYKVSYAGNGIQNGTIHVTNTYVNIEKISVGAEKSWTDGYDQPIDPPEDAVQVDVWRSISKHPESNKPGETEEPTDPTPTGEKTVTFMVVDSKNESYNVTRTFNVPVNTTINLKMTSISLFKSNVIVKINDEELDSNFYNVEDGDMAGTRGTLSFSYKVTDDTTIVITHNNGWMDHDYKLYLNDKELTESGSSGETGGESGGEETIPEYVTVTFDIRLGTNPEDSSQYFTSKYLVKSNSEIYVNLLDEYGGHLYQYQLNIEKDGSSYTDFYDNNYSAKLPVGTSDITYTITKNPNKNPVTKGLEVYDSTKTQISPISATSLVSTYANIATRAGSGITENTTPYNPDDEYMGTLTLNSANSWKDTLRNLPATDKDGNRYYYYCVEHPTDDYSVIYENNNIYDDNGTVKITNKQATVPKGNLNVTKKWEDSDGKESIPTNGKVTLQLWRKADTSGGSGAKPDEETTAMTFSDTAVNVPIPEKFQSKDISEITVTFEGNVPSEFNVSYDYTEETATASIIMPIANANGNTWTDTPTGKVKNIHFTGTGLDKIKSVAVGYADNSNYTVKAAIEPDQVGEVKIMAMGDSITDGYINGDNGYRKYMYNILTKAGYKIDMVGRKNNDLQRTYTDNGETFSYDPAHEGYSTYSIKSYNNPQNRTGLYETLENENAVDNAKGKAFDVNQPDIVLLMIGTNDILDGHDTATSESIKDRLQELVTYIFNHVPDVHLYIASPPPLSEKSTFFNVQGGYGGAITQAKIDKNQTDYNTAIQEIVASEMAKGNYCKYVDMYSTFLNDSRGFEALLTGNGDYCHPNETGYKLMGEKWAEVLKNDLQTTAIRNKAVTPMAIATDMTKSVHIIPEGATLVEEFELTQTPGWTKEFSNLPVTDPDGNPYVYYIKETDGTTGYTVTYEDGVKLVEGDTAEIVVTNTKKESSTTTMPSTGGNGARKYYTVGGMLLMLSACGWAMRRRKRVIPH